MSLDQDDIRLFQAQTKGVKKLVQDTYVAPREKQKTRRQYNELIQQQDTRFYFSDQYEPLLQQDQKVRYLRDGENSHLLKQLRRGDFFPELFLDLHGLTQLQAKQELGALIAACRREHVFCACVMHGHGKHILKQQTPLWLAQHPHVMAFHQAPKEYGGDAALLVLIEVEEWLPPELP